MDSPLRDLRYGYRRLRRSHAIVSLIAAFTAGNLLQRLLFGVKPHDPLTLASVMVVLMLIAVLACYLPARRAANVDPIVALRYE